MNNQQRAGAIASFICASSFIIGLCLVLLIVPDFNDGPDQRFKVLSQSSLLMQVWYFLVYLVFGVSMLILSISLLRTKSKEPSSLEQITMLMSYLWSCYIFASGLIAILSIEFLFSGHFKLGDTSLDLWRDIYSIQMGLGEGAEWVGAIWVVLINTCILKTRKLPSALAYFGYFISIFGFFTLVPVLQPIGAIFGLLQIIWFLIVGILMFRQKT
ncbi:hypothetical protein [Glaciecola sp. KUL10]|uniref:hypothetical protein n=1 Tax=Glaciecola sp. (strain KUL10) TaxID=2161813 RepID=UPI000D78C727|nr:hypothetical protein [Glaciecola sp. KUL10]